MSCEFIVLATLVAIRGASLPLASYSRSKAASSLVNFVFRAKGSHFMAVYLVLASTLRAIWSRTTGSIQTV